MREIRKKMKWPIQPIDMFLLPVNVLNGYVTFQGEADFGYCAAKDMHYYGFKNGLHISRLGIIIQYFLFPAHSHDIHSFETMLEEFEGVETDDKNWH